jgi:hypothetical protein
VQLLGQIVNHYDAPDDPGCDFTGLLEAVHAIDGIARIRFASPHPRHFRRSLSGVRWRACRRSAGICICRCNRDRRASSSGCGAAIRARAISISSRASGRGCRT